MMGYVKRVHHCPTPADGRNGDIWECDVCKTRWAYKTHYGWAMIGGNAR